MTLVLEQSFPLGRFHATRWNQNPFEDRHGEWPPSPWRLLRTLAARWFQYARETGDEDEESRNELLEQLAARPPAFQIPAFTWRGEPGPRQYQKTEVTWTDARAKAAGYKKAKTNLMVDVFRAISPDDKLIWVWDGIELAPHLEALLRELLKRILYFGRSEAHCRFAISTTPAQELSRCELLTANKRDAPVLVASPGTKLNLESLLASSDDRLLKGRSIPSDTEWRFAQLPDQTAAIPRSLRKPQFPVDLKVIQFAVGGRIFPEPAQWVRVAERFRGCVLKHAARIISGEKCSIYRELPDGLRDKLKLLSGKDAYGKPVQDHQHAFFFFTPDEIGNPARLVVYRRSALDGNHDQPFEVEAILAASHEPISWQSGDPEWSLRLLPLPFEMPAPQGCWEGSCAFRVWRSATPFVPPTRRRFRKNGRLRTSEAAPALLRKALAQHLLTIGSSAKVNNIRCLDDSGNSLPVGSNEDPRHFIWVTVHETLTERHDRSKDRRRSVRAGFQFQVEFSEPVYGPLLVGHSSHFGLGMFLPEK